MSPYSFASIAEILDAAVTSAHQDNAQITTLGYDTRTLIHPPTCLFFAIQGKNKDGHVYLQEAFDKGVRNFVVSKSNIQDFLADHLECNIMCVENAVVAMQTLAAHHREQFNIPIVGITGSNGKTIVKEWLFQLLSPDFNIVRSPRSYNSQIGVPLSVWLLEEDHNFGIFEAGISEPGEMDRLEKVIAPTIGIFTNIGDAHQAFFNNLEQKAEEKLKLFQHSDLLIYCRDHDVVHETVSRKIREGYFHPDMQVLDWSMHHNDATIYIEKTIGTGQGTELLIWYDGEQQRLSLGFQDRASIENALHCLALLLHLGYSHATLQQRVDRLHSIEMRLEIKSGIHGATIINDSYNSDLASLGIALDTLNTQNQHNIKRVILSDILETGKDAAVLYQQVSAMLSQKGINHLIGIGPAIQANSGRFGGETAFFESTEAFLSDFNFDALQNEAILLKGSRSFGFEAIARKLQQKTHQTILEINLNALTNNLNVYRSMLKPETRVMAMVKAFSYGSGSYEIANILQFHKVNYLAVAYADEGVYLREQGISMPIMVMNPEESAFEQLIRYKLEPEIYSFRVLDLFLDAIKSHSKDAMPLSIHIKLDTGMHRLGFNEEDITLLTEKLLTNPKLYVQSIFSHLASADIVGHDAFTRGQADIFERGSSFIIQKLGYPVLRHLLNSPGIARMPELQYDMVRLGIGLYGIDPAAKVQSRLEQVSTLKTHISQIRNVPKGESVGYSRRAVMEKDSVIATIGIGYADGFPRSLGHQKFSVLVNGSRVPVIGNVCMDMSMIDITGISAQEGDEVLIFGPDKPIEEMAEAASTIPYEILTGVSQRVKRVYWRE